MRSIGLDAPEPKDKKTAEGWAFSIRVLMERFAQLPGILAERTSEDMANAATVMAVYVLKCYHSRDPHFNLETVREGITTAGPLGAGRLKEEFQETVDYVGCIF